MQFTASEKIEALANNGHEIVTFDFLDWLHNEVLLVKDELGQDYVHFKKNSWLDYEITMPTHIQAYFRDQILSRNTINDVLLIGEVEQAITEWAKDQFHDDCHAYGKRRMADLIPV